MKGLWQTGFLALLASTASATISTVEEIYKKCEATTREEFEPCLLTLIEEIRPMMEEGIPEIGLPPISNVTLDDVQVSEENGENFLRASFHDFNIKGFEEFDLQKLKIDFANRQATYEAHFPEIFAAGRYKMDASLLFVPLKGAGTTWFRLINFWVGGKSDFIYKEVDGDLRCQLVNTEIDYTIGNVTLRLNGLFGNDPFLSEAGTAFINQNVDALMEELDPAMRRNLARIAHEHFNGVMKNVKYENLAGRQFY